MHALGADALGKLWERIGVFVQGKVPTKVSQLTNDAGYLTEAPTKVSQLTNDADYVKSSDLTTQLDKKANDFSILLYNGNKGNPNPVRFASFNYSSCNSENGIAAKIGMVSGHGNGTSYAFLQDAIIRVSHTGSVSVDNFKYYGANVTYDGASRQYGDIFWLVDTTNKIVDFYCLMGQYARVYQTPWKRLTYSTGGTVTQHTSCAIYSSGDKVWANNSDIALASDIPTVPTNVSAFTNDAGYLTQHQSLAEYATTSDLDSLRNTVEQLADSMVTVHSGTEANMVSTLGEDGDIYLVTE